MLTLTKPQRKAVKRVYDRKMEAPQLLSYRQFRATVQPGYDCIMLQWCGMWLGIEKDGYTHS